MNSTMVVAFLINAAWQIALVALTAAACARMMRGVRARDEHRLWVAALIVAVALPVVSTIGLPDLGDLGDLNDLNVAAGFSPPRAAGFGPPESQPAEAGRYVTNFTLPRPRMSNPAPDIALLIASLYAFFLATRALVLYRGWRRTASLRASAMSATADAVRTAAARCRDAFALGDVPLLVSPKADAPLTIGGVIVLPIGIEEKLSEEALLAVIGHEMAHIRRRDFAINLFYEAMVALIAFHPAAAFIRRRLAQTREHACDEMVAATLVKPVRYAHALLDVAAMLAPAAKPAWSLAMVDRGFEERVLRLARPRRGGAYARVMVAASCVLLASSIAIGAAFAVERRHPVGRSADFPSASTPIGDRRTGRLEAGVPDPCAAGRARDASAIPALIAMIGDDTPVSSDTRCYGNRWSPAIAVFVRPTIGEAAAMALASIGSPSIDALVPMLDAPSAVVRRNAAWAIGEIRGGFLTDRSAAIEPLLRIINDSDATVRRAAAFAFGELRSDEAVEPLILALADPDAAVRATSAWALGEIRAPDAVAMLERVAENDPSDDARAAARYALNEIND